MKASKEAIGAGSAAEGEELLGAGEAAGVLGLPKKWLASFWLHRTPHLPIQRSRVPSPSELSQWEHFE